MFKKNQKSCYGLEIDHTNLVSIEGVVDRRNRRIVTPVGAAATIVPRPPDTHVPEKRSTLPQTTFPQTIFPQMTFPQKHYSPSNFSPKGTFPKN
jgi:hypothetical protein